MCWFGRNVDRGGFRRCVFWRFGRGVYCGLCGDPGLWFRLGLRVGLAMAIRPKSDAIGGKAEITGIRIDGEGRHAGEALHRGHGGETCANEAVLRSESLCLVQRFAGHDRDRDAVFLQHAPIVFQLGHGIGCHAVETFFDTEGGQFRVGGRHRERGIEHLIIGQDEQRLEIFALARDGLRAQGTKRTIEVVDGQRRLTDHGPMARGLAMGQRDAVCRKEECDIHRQVRPQSIVSGRCANATIAPFYRDLCRGKTIASPHGSAQRVQV